MTKRIKECSKQVTQKAPLSYVQRITTIGLSQLPVTTLQHPAFLFLAALISSQKSAILTGEIDAINLLNHNVQITLSKMYLQHTVTFTAPIPRNPTENGVPLCNCIDAM